DLTVGVQRQRVDAANKPIGVGAEARAGGVISLTRGSVAAQRDWNDGLLAYRGLMQTNSTQVSTNDVASTGVKAWREVSGYSGATSIITMAGGSVTTQGNESYGLLAQNLGSSITASDLSVTTSGAQ